MLSGSGTGGAYHAGVLQALHEAGVRVDLVAGRGIGVAGALFAAIDGSARLWEENGIWRSDGVRRFYGWRTPLRVAAWALAGAGLVLAVPLAVLGLAVVVAMAGTMLALVGFAGAGAALTGSYGGWTNALFDPASLPTVIPRLAVLAILVAMSAAVFGAVAGGRAHRGARRVRRGIAGRMVGGPFSSAALLDRCASELWNLIRGAAPLAAPPPAELARRYVELLAENLGQPGFRELMIGVHDLDARRDLVFALLSSRYRPRFFTRPGPGLLERQIEAFDLAGAARDHVLDALGAALTLPVATEPHLVTFAPEGPWRGETHRVCDRPGGLVRLIDEIAAAGAEQVIVAAPSPPPGRPHELSAGRADLRGGAGEPLAAFETAALRDVIEHASGRFAGLFIIRPSHNPVGPLDFRGIHDERSDRRHTVAELVDRGYEDAYRQFIEPVVGASGDRIESVT